MPVSPATTKPGRKIWITPAVAFAIAAIVTLYYAPFLDSFFAYDDFRYLENMYKGFLDILLGYGSFRVVSNLSWWPVFLLSGMDPVAYNAFSFGMLFLDALVFYFLCRELVADLATAALAAVLFAGGSVGADALFWKCTNSTLICFFFYVLSLIAYLKWRRGGATTLFAASLAAFLLAMLSKEEAASLPGIVILLELLFLKERSVTALFRRVAPFAAIILMYIVGSREFFQWVAREPEPAKFFKVRPLHTLLTPWSVFSLPPHGLFDFSNPLLYLVPAALIGALFFIPYKKEFCFAFGWIFLTFIPQSFTSLGQIEPKYLFNSVSRYLFLPSAGAALALAVVLAGIGSRWGRRVGVSLAVAVLGVYFCVNYVRVQERGREWRQDAKAVQAFLAALKEKVPQFPPKTNVIVVNRPTGRAYVQQALRASYANPDITWIVDPSTYRPANGENAYLIYCVWDQDRNVRLFIDEFMPAMARNMAARQ